MLLTKQEQKIYREILGTTYWKSKFKFLREHNGMRPGKIHLLVGVTSGGKSTLVRSLILDALSQNKNNGNILLWLTEESGYDFESEISQTNMLDVFEGNILEKLCVASEQNYQSETRKTPRELFQHLEEMLIETGAEMLIFDNCTTSDIFTDKIDNQAAVALRLKALAIKLSIPVVLVAHTKKDVMDNSTRILEHNDIRGCSKIVNISEYAYVLQRFTCDEKIYPTIRITKHRSSNIRDSIFLLDYDHETRLYHGSKPLNFDAIKEIYKKRNRL